MNFCRVLQTGHSLCWSSLGIFRPIELGSSHSTKRDGFRGGKALEQRLRIFVNGSYMAVQFAADQLLLVKSGIVPKGKFQLAGKSAHYRPRPPTHSACFYR